MPGLNLKVGGFGGVRTGPFQNTAPGVGPASYSSTAFSTGYVSQPASAAGILAPNDGFGLSLWLGIAAIVALVLVRQSLPG